jgi:polysaccharide export outer membrane protein
MRTENGKPTSLPFNYKDIVEGKNLQQNIELKPGDTVIVP